MFKTDKDYYGDKSFVSNSMIGRLLEDEMTFIRWMNNDHVYLPTTPMAFGNLIHNKYFEFLNDGPVDDNELDIIMVEDYSLRSKAGKEFHADLMLQFPGRQILKRSEWDFGLELIEKMKVDNVINDYIAKLREKYILQFEIQATGELDGVPIKGKADIGCFDFDGVLCKLIDLKTTSKMSGFKASVRKYGYNRQWLFYAILFGLNPTEDVFDFLVVEKDSARTAIFKTDRPGFLEESKTALRYGMDRIKQFRSNNLLMLKTNTL